MFLELQGLVRVHSMFESILISHRCPGPLCTSMHSTSFLSSNARGLACGPASCFRATTSGLSHGFSIALM